MVIITSLFPLGLSPSTQYRVTVRSKHLRAPGQAQPAPPPEEAPGAYTDFRTLAKGLPDPPQVSGVSFPINTVFNFLKN